MSARDVMAQQVPSSSAELCFGVADAQITALAAAGYTIVRKDEVREAALSEAELAVWKSLSDTPKFAEPQVIAQRAIRSLKQKEANQ